MKITQYGMSVSPNALIPYFTAYLIYYFHNLKNSGERQKRISESVSKNMLFFRTLFNSSNTIITE